MLKITCAQCNASLQVPPNLAGRTITCPKCKKPTLVALAPVALEPEDVELEELEEIVDDVDDAEDAAFMPVAAKSPPKPAAKAPAKAAAKPPAKAPSKSPAKRSSRNDEDEDEADFEPEFEMDEPAKSRKGLWIGLGIGGGVLGLALAGVAVWMATQPAAPPDPMAQLKKMEADLKAGKIPGFPADMIPKDFPLPPNVDPKTLVPPDFNPQDLVRGPGTTPKKAKVDPAEAGKHATTILHVSAGDGSKIDGCGFFAVERGLIVTSIDVVGMRPLDAKEPSKIEVVCDSGEPSEKTLPAKLLGADRESNVALLKIDGKTDDLPEPLAVEPAEKGNNAKQLLLFAMPTVGEADRHVVSAKAALKYHGPGYFAWALESPLAPGNSGSPIVNARGAAVGLCVVPRSEKLVQVVATGDQIRDACRGRVVDMQIRPVVREGEENRVPVEAYFLDPQKNIAKVAVEYWQAELREQQPPLQAPSERKMTVDDLKTQAFATYANGKATFEFPMPRPRNEQALWVRVAMSDAAGNTWWGPSHAMRVDAVLDRRGTPIKLDAAKNPKNSIKIDTELESSTAGNSNANRDGMHARLTEMRTSLPDGARSDLKINDFDRGTHDFKPMWALSNKANKALRACPLNFTLASDGHVMERGPRTLDPGLSPLDRLQAEDYLARTCNALEASCLTLPAAVEVNDTWKSPFPFTLPIGEEPEIADVALTCTYNGIRNVEGRDRAVVSALGPLVPRKGPDSSILFGKTQAIFQVDPTSGSVLDARIWIVADYITPTRKRARSQWNIDFVRTPSDQVAVAPKTKTPKTPPVTTKIPVDKTPPVKTPPVIAKTPSGPVGDKTVIADLAFETVKVDAATLLRSLTWAVDGKSFYCLQSTGKLQQFGSDDLAVMAEADLGQGCTGMALSSEGLLVAMPAAEEAVVVDPTGLTVRRKISISGLDRLTAGAKVSYAVALTKGGETILFDARTAKIASKQRVDELALGAGTFLLATMTPDGKYLFAEARTGKLHRLRIVDHMLVHEQPTNRPIAAKTGRIDISPDGNYVCLSTEAGNSDTSLRTFVYQVEDLQSPDVVLNAGATPRTVGFDPPRHLIYAQNSKFALIAFTNSGKKLQEYELPRVGETRQIVCGRTGDVLVLTEQRLFRARREK